MTPGDDDHSIFDDPAFGDHLDAGEHGEEAEGLELDDSQSVEIRKIFLITLPQYLEPVEQMLEVLIASETTDEETSQTLATTLASISAAAERIGITDVLNEIDNMRGLLHELQDTSGDERRDVESALMQSLMAIQAISEGAGGSPKAETAADGGETLFSVLHHVPGVEPAALKKLTAAGLVNLEQLRMARPDEVVAVTGLSAAVVDAILKAVRERTGSGAATPAEEAAAPSAPLAAAPAASKDAPAPAPAPAPPAPPAAPASTSAAASAKGAATAKAPAAAASTAAASTAAAPIPKAAAPAAARRGASVRPGADSAVDPATSVREERASEAPKQRPVIKVRPKEAPERASLVARSDSDDPQTVALKLELEEALTAQVDAEAELDEVRVLLQRKRQRAVELREEVEVLRTQREQLETEIEPLSSRTIVELGELTKLRQRNDLLHEQLGLITRTYEQHRAHLARLEAAHTAVERAQTDEVERLLELRARVERMLSASDPRRVLDTQKRRRKPPALPLPTSIARRSEAPAPPSQADASLEPAPEEPGRKNG